MVYQPWGSHFPAAAHVDCYIIKCLQTVCTVRAVLEVPWLTLSNSRAHCDFVQEVNRWCVVRSRLSAEGPRAGQAPGFHTIPTDWHLTAHMTATLQDHGPWTPSKFTAMELWRFGNSDIWFPSKLRPSAHAGWCRTIQAQHISLGKDVPLFSTGYDSRKTTGRRFGCIDIDKRLMLIIRLEFSKSIHFTLAPIWSA